VIRVIISDDETNHIKCETWNKEWLFRDKFLYRDFFNSVSHMISEYIKELKQEQRERDQQ